MFFGKNPGWILYAKQNRFPCFSYFIGKLFWTQRIYLWGNKRKVFIKINPSKVVFAVIIVFQFVNFQSYINIARDQKYWHRLGFCISNTPYSECPWTLKIHCCQTFVYFAFLHNCYRYPLNTKKMLSNLVYFAFFLSPNLLFCNLTFFCRLSEDSPKAARSVRKFDSKSWN